VLQLAKRIIFTISSVRRLRNLKPRARIEGPERKALRAVIIMMWTFKFKFKLVSFVPKEKTTSPSRRNLIPVAIR